MRLSRLAALACLTACAPPAVRGGPPPASADEPPAASSSVASVPAAAPAAPPATASARARLAVGESLRTPWGVELVFTGSGWATEEDGRHDPFVTLALVREGVREGATIYASEGWLGEQENLGVRWRLLADPAADGMQAAAVEVEVREPQPIASAVRAVLAAGETLRTPWGDQVTFRYYSRNAQVAGRTEHFVAIQVRRGDRFEDVEISETGWSEPRETLGVRWRALGAPSVERVEIEVLRP